MAGSAGSFSQNAGGIYVPIRWASQGVTSATTHTLGPVTFVDDGRSTYIITDCNIGWDSVASTNVLCVAEIGANVFFCDEQSFTEGQGLSQWSGYVIFNPSTDALLVKVQSTTLANIGISVTGFKFFPSPGFS